MRGVRSFADAHTRNSAPGGRHRAGPKATRAVQGRPPFFPIAYRHSTELLFFSTTTQKYSRALSVSAHFFWITPRWATIAETAASTDLRPQTLACQKSRLPPTPPFPRSSKRLRAGARWRWSPRRPPSCTGHARHARPRCPPGTMLATRTRAQSTLCVLWSRWPLDLPIIGQTMTDPSLENADARPVISPDPVRPFL